MKRSRCVSVCGGRATLLLAIPIGSFALLGLLPRGTRAQSDAAAPAASGDDSTKENAAGAANQSGDKKEKTAGDQKPDPVTPGEVLSFRQAKVAAEMTELEERMYRLSEALKALEPENSSRLMLGLKFAREELILHQMKETQKLLDRLTLAEAATEEKQLLSKLQRLHDLLLATDLDFQMQLERLRQLREALRRLDKAIQEEDRERKASASTAEKQKELDGLRKKHATLEELIKRQAEHVAQGAKLADAVKDVAEPGDDAKNSLDELAKEQAKTRDGAKALAEAATQAGKQSANLQTADAQMGEAGQSLSKHEPTPAVPHQKEALSALEKERDETAEAIRRAEAELAEANFAAMKRDQSQNRQLNEGITQLVRDLGEAGAGALGELLRADGSMSSAEGRLGNQQAEPASEDQQQALDSLKYAKEQLEAEAEKLLNQLRAEVKRRVMEGLTLMLEKQIAVREATETVGPKAAKGSRQAINAVVGLGKSEGRIMEIANELITLVEETEFGIALPAALIMVRDEMADVQASLADGDGSEQVVNDQRQIEADLHDLLDAMKQLPSSASPGKAQRGQADRRRELNRLIAELKMIRLLQLRTNRQTADVDQSRNDQSRSGDEVSAALREAIERVADQQDYVRAATERLAEERGDELQGGN
ncbi:MAG TPA: hypothetical protein VF306_03920 [Pirellulales bacterium]